MRRLPLLISVSALLSACNLQQQPPIIPTPIVVTATQPPANMPADQPTVQLQATPTQLLLVTVTPQQPPTTISIDGQPQPDTPGPRLDPAQADDRYELQARAGATVRLNYEIILERGTVTLSLQGPEGLLWQQVFTASTSGQHEIPDAAGGLYEVLVDIEHFSGNYALSWG